MFPCDILAEIFSHLSYQCLYNTIKVSKLFLSVSQNQLIIRHRSNPILPILYNCTIQDKFIRLLDNAYSKYIRENRLSLYYFIFSINDSKNDKYDITPDIFPYTSNHINLLYNHVILHIKTNNNSTNVLSKYGHSQAITPIFEKGYTILSWLLDKSIEVRKTNRYNDESCTNDIYVWWDVDKLL